MLIDATRRTSAPTAACASRNGMPGAHEVLGEVGRGQVGLVGGGSHRVGVEVAASRRRRRAPQASRHVSTASNSGSLSSWRSRLYASGRPLSVASSP